MSASVYWRPSSDKGRSLGVDAPSSFADLMASRFGATEPWEISHVDIDWIQGVLDATKRPEFARMLELIADHGSVTIWRKL